MNQTNKEIEEMENFEVVDEVTQTRWAYPCQITKFQEECIREALLSHEKAVEEEAKGELEEKLPKPEEKHWATSQKGIGWNNCLEEVKKIIKEVFEK